MFFDIAAGFVRGVYYEEDESDRGLRIFDRRDAQVCDQQKWLTIYCQAAKMEKITNAHN